MPSVEPLPKIAIAMAVFDDERYLPLALDALAAQTLRDFHVTVYDDGSSDRSASIAESYTGRLPLRVIRGPHRGRHFAKQTAWAEAARAPYLLVMDSDIVPRPDALERMLALIEGDPSVAAVSGRALAFGGRRLGRSQRFLEQFFYEVNSGPSEQGRWIVGGFVLLRRSALDGIEVGSAVGEDNELSEKLRARWRLLAPAELAVDHHGVPTSVAGFLRRSERDGVRVSALVRKYPRARQIGNVARLVPLPVLALGVAGGVARLPWVIAACGAALCGYIGAFVVASRRVRGTLGDRLSAASLFTIGNVAFGWGYLREALRERSAMMRDPARRF